MMEANTEAIKSLDTLKELKVLMLASRDNPEEPVEIGNVYKAFREAFHKDKKGSLTAVMQHLSDLDPAKVMKFTGAYC